MMLNLKQELLHWLENDNARLARSQWILGIATKTLERWINQRLEITLEEKESDKEETLEL